MQEQVGRELPDIQPPRDVVRNQTEKMVEIHRVVQRENQLDDRLKEKNGRARDDDVAKAGVSIPPQLMRGPYEPGYRDREPILVSVSAAGRESKIGESRLVSGCSSPAKAYFGLAGALRRDGPGIHYRAARKSQGKSRPNLKVQLISFATYIGRGPRPTSALHHSESETFPLRWTHTMQNMQRKSLFLLMTWSCSVRRSSRIRFL